MLEKRKAIETLGEASLLLPAQTAAALAANDRLKYYFSVLEVAIQHADAPSSAPMDLSRERVAAGVRETWPDEMSVGAVRVGGEYEFPQLEGLLRAVVADLATMAAPLTAVDSSGEIAQRVHAQKAWLEGLSTSRLAPAAIKRIVGAGDNGVDTVHRLVMDMHKAVNALVAKTAAELVEGAHVWNLEKEDRARVVAFMRGLNRTAWVKFDHPGLATAATRSGKRLLIQNDIGVNAAHVLVIAIVGRVLTLTYSDLHQTRFEFFRDVLGSHGVHWSVVQPHAGDALNLGEVYWVGTATFEAPDLPALDEVLSFIGSRIVFLIDWNRARKRLQAFVDRECARNVLRAVADREVGHVGWLRLGAERLLFGVMQAVGDGAFRLGDTLEDVLGDAAAETFLLDTLTLCAQGLRDGRAPSQIEDEVRLLLRRQLQDRSSEFDLAAEHASYCHEIALAVRDSLAHPHDFDRDAVARAKAWESRADELVTQARSLAERHPRRRAFAQLVGSADDVADALEEAMFVMELLSEHAATLLGGTLQKVLLPLADTVLDGVRDYVRALAIGRGLRRSAPLEDSHEFLEVTWRMMHAERRGDEQLRAARRQILATAQSSAGLMLATDLAFQLETATDHLLTVAYLLRDLVLDRAVAAG